MEQEGAEAQDSVTTEGAGPAQAETGQETPDLDEVKRKFREALDRKRHQQTTANAEGLPDTGKVHGQHGPASSRRSFRRKSGS